MLDVRNPAHLQRVRAFADQAGLRGQLDTQLAYLDAYASRRADGTVDRRATRCEIYPDAAPHSFGFTMYRRDPETGEYRHWFCGGLLFHGVHDGHGSGAEPTFAVTLDATTGWSIHT